MIRLAHFVTHPIQYFTPLYRQIAEQPGIDLTVYFGSKFGLQPSFDEGFGRAIQFDVPLLAGYSSRFLANLASGLPTDSFANFDCPEVDHLLSQHGFDALWVHGWGYKAHWQCFKAARRHRVPLLIRADTNALRKPKYSWQWLLSNLRVGRILRGAAGCLFIGKSNREYYLSIGVEMMCCFRPIIRSKRGALRRLPLSWKRRTDSVTVTPSSKKTLWLSVFPRFIRRSDSTMRYRPSAGWDAGPNYGSWATARNGSVLSY